MSGSLKTTLRGLLTLALFSPPTFAEDIPRGDGYDGRSSGIDTSLDYSHIIAQNRSRYPQRPGESDGAYAVRMAQIDASYAPAAPADTGTVDRAEKLGDAAQIALEGKKSAAASSLDLWVRAFNMRMDGSSGGTAGAAAADANATGMEEKSAAYGQQSTADDIAYVNNQAGKVRLLADAPDNDAGAPPSRATVASVAAGLSDESKDALKTRGIDPEEAVERLLSGEVDLTNRTSVMTALAEMSKISVTELAKVQALADTTPLGTGLQGDERIAERGLRTDDPEGKEGRGTVVKNGDKNQDGDTSEFAKKPTGNWLAGIPISIINREVMGYRIGDILGIKSKAKGKDDSDTAASATANGNLKSPTKAPPKRLLAKKTSPVEKYRLQENGVTTLRPGSHIFQVAHRQFREFNKWREKRAHRGGRVAQNP